MTTQQFAASVEKDVKAAGFTPAERLAFYAASVKWPDDLTAYEVVLLNRYEAVRYRERAA